MTRRARFLVIGLIILAYVPTFADMAHAWKTDSYAGHGQFVPIFSALIAWFDREKLRSAAGRGHSGGAVVMLAGLAMLGLGYVSESLLVRSLSIAMAAAGAVLWTFGAACLRQAAFPVGFLAFMAPPPHAAVAAVTLHVQVFAASFAAGALRLVGVPVYQTGAIIELPRMTLEVAEICNGLRFLLALVVLTTAFAEVSQRTVARKLVLAGSAIPVAIMANAVRVAVIGLGVQYIGPQAASGVIHHSIGKAVWAMTLVPLIALGWWLGRRGGTTGNGQGETVSLPATGGSEVR